MSGSVIRNAIVDLRRMAWRSAKRRLVLAAIAGTCSAASAMLKRLMLAGIRAANSVCALSPAGRGRAARLWHPERVSHDDSVAVRPDIAAAGALNPAKEPAAARGGGAVRPVGRRPQRQRSQVHTKASTLVSVRTKSR